jgi:hypothetical protein
MVSSLRPNDSKERAKTITYCSLKQFKNRHSKTNPKKLPFFHLRLRFLHSSHKNNRHHKKQNLKNSRTGKASLAGAAWEQEVI